MSVRATMKVWPPKPMTAHVATMQQTPPQITKEEDEHDA